MRAITVCVDFSDLLAVTLPYNRHHFEDVLIVTTPNDYRTIEVALENEAMVYTTNVFYEGGAKFNKWAALEEGLNRFGRMSWLCLIDADVLWPKSIEHEYLEGYLYTPLRRMVYSIDVDTVQILTQDERLWRTYSLHPQQHEWAGYTQIFLGTDEHLGEPPWHETNWRHAGGADSFFQAKWPQENKLRPRFEVLHLGESGANWCGRASRYLDGSVPELSKQRREELHRLIRSRRAGPHRFDHEKLM